MRFLKKSKKNYTFCWTDDSFIIYICKSVGKQGFLLIGKYFSEKYYELKFREE